MKTVGVLIVLALVGSGCSGIGASTKDDGAESAVCGFLDHVQRISHNNKSQAAALRDLEQLEPRLRTLSSRSRGPQHADLEIILAAVRQALSQRSMQSLVTDRVARAGSSLQHGCH